MDPKAKLVPANEIPEGFTTDDPNNPSATASQQQQVAEGKEREMKRQAILEQALTQEALARLRRIKLVKPQKASAVEGLICNMAVSGKLPSRITEGRLIELLEGVNAQSSQKAQKSSIQIQRKRYQDDSDDDDDNDEDLL